MKLLLVPGDPAEGGELRITPPQAGQHIEFHLRNKSSEKIGVVVFVNGKSTLESTEPPEMCRPWVLPPDGTRPSLQFNALVQLSSVAPPVQYTSNPAGYV